MHYFRIEANAKNTSFVSDTIYCYVSQQFKTEISRPQDAASSCAFSRDDPLPHTLVD